MRTPWPEPFPKQGRGQEYSEKASGRACEYRKSASQRAERGPGSQHVGFQDVEAALAIQKVNQAAIVNSHIVGRDARVT